VGDQAAERRAALIMALARVGIHDATALHDVYRMTHNKIQGVCLTVCLDYQDAQDAVQDCYLAVWRSAAQFDATRASPITWLVRIARNKAIDRLRKRHRDMARDMSAIDDLHAESALDPEQALAADQRRELAAASVATLDGMQAALVRAIFVEGLTYTQLAARSGAPLATVKSRVRRAILGLRAQLEGRV
jgi:RNA polymerase sigma-70 factor, ECF subfamily